MSNINVHGYTMTLRLNKGIIMRLLLHCSSSSSSSSSSLRGYVTTQSGFSDECLIGKDVVAIGRCTSWHIFFLWRNSP
jgi:hypothetical protein